MNNARTKFIIAVTGRLSAARDSDAKVELIEELSENLYSRYQDMVAAGMPEEEAYEKALGELGDVDELLAYLDGTAADGAWAKPEGDFKSFANDLLEDVRGVAQSAIHIAREAMDTASENFQKSGGFSFTVNNGGRAAGVSCTGDLNFSVDDDSGDVEIPAEGIHSVHVGLTDGDVTVRQDGDPQGPVRIVGDTEELELRLGGNGTLFIRQGKTASSSFFFGRMLRSTDIELILPRRHWSALTVGTASGDVEIGEGLEADRVSVNTASGDVDIHSGLRAAHVAVKTASGDLDIQEGSCGQLTFTSASGDFNGDNIAAEGMQAETMSGDIELYGTLQAIQCSTASGDLYVRTNVLPRQLEASSKSGDCEVAVPDGAGFRVQFRTVSGDLHSDFALTGPIGKRSGEAAYLDGGDRMFHMSSVSGNVSLRRQP